MARTDHLRSGSREWAAAGCAAQTYLFRRRPARTGIRQHVALLRLRARHRVRDGLRVTGVPTSTATRGLALSLGITLIDLDDTGHLDVCNGIASDLVIGERDGTASRPHLSPPGGHDRDCWPMKAAVKHGGQQIRIQERANPNIAQVGR